MTFNQPVFFLFVCLFFFSFLKFIYLFFLSIYHLFMSPAWNHLGVIIAWILVFGCNYQHHFLRVVNIDYRMSLLFSNILHILYSIGVLLLCCYHACDTSTWVLHHQRPFCFPKASGSDHTAWHSCWWVLKNLAAILCFNIS